MGWFDNVVSAVGTAVNDAATAVGGAVTDAAAAAAAAAQAAAQAAADAAAAVAAAAATVVNSVAGVVNDAGEAVQDAAEWAAQQTATIIDLGEGMIQIVYGDGFTYVTDAASYYADQAAQAAIAAAEDAMYAAAYATDAVADAVGDAANAVGAAVTDVGEAVGAAATDVGEAVGSAATWLGTGVEDVAEGVDHLAGQVGEAVQGTIEDGAEVMTNATRGTFLYDTTVGITTIVTTGTGAFIDLAVNTVDSYTDVYEGAGNVLQGDFAAVGEILGENVSEHFGVAVTTDGRGVWEASFTTAIGDVDSTLGIRGGVTADGDVVTGIRGTTDVDLGEADVSIGVDAGASVGLSGVSGSVGGEGALRTDLADVGGSAQVAGGVGGDGATATAAAEEHVVVEGVGEQRIGAEAEVGLLTEDGLFDASGRSEAVVDTAFGGVSHAAETSVGSVHGEDGSLLGVEGSARSEQHTDVLGNTTDSAFEAKAGVVGGRDEDGDPLLGGFVEASASTDVDSALFDLSTEVSGGIEAEVSTSGASFGAETSGSSEQTVLGVETGIAGSVGGKVDATSLFDEESRVSVEAEADVSGRGVGASGAAGAAVGAEVSETGATAEADVDGRVGLFGGEATAHAGGEVGVDEARGLFAEAEVGALGAEAEAGIGTVEGVDVAVDLGGDGAAAPEVAVQSRELTEEPAATASVFEGPAAEAVAPVAAPAPASVFAAPRPIAGVRRTADDEDDDVVVRPNGRLQPPGQAAAKGRAEPAADDDGDGAGATGAGAAVAAGGASLTAFATEDAAGDLADGSPLAAFAAEAEEEGILDGALDRLEELGDGLGELVDDLNPFD